jgi:lysophospholipase L1-like esterase
MTDVARVRNIGRPLALLAAIPVLLLLDSGVAFARGWPASGRLDAMVVTGAALALAALLAIAVSKRGRSLLRQWGGSCVYVAFSLLGAWLVAEVVVAGFLLFFPQQDSRYPPAKIHRRTPNAEWLFRPDPAHVPGIEGDSRYTTNSLGIRGPELPDGDGTYRILAIGGSTTEDTYLDDTETWAHLIMERLNQEEGRGRVWVGSVGISGFTTVHHLQFVEKSPLMKQVDALAFLIGANDFSSFLRGGGIEVSPSRPAPAAEVPRPLWRSSPIIGFARAVWVARIRAAAAGELADGEQYVARRDVRQGSTVRDTLSDMTKAVADYEARIETLVELSRGYGIRPIFVTQPTLWDENLSERGRSLLWLGDITGSDFLSARAGRLGIDRYNAALLGACRRMDVECIDTESMNGAERFFFDDFHFTEAGARELARLVSEHLTAHADHGQD